MPSASSKQLSVVAVEAAIGIPAKDWPGRCHEIAGRILDAGVVSGRLAYGAWRGFMHPASIFGTRRGAGFTHHGWIVSDDERSVVDPTRWVFEHTAPYIYTGTLTREYDEGANEVRHELRAAMGRGEAPTWSANDRQSDLLEFCHVETTAHLRALLGNARSISVPQVLWLANLPPRLLEPYVVPIYRALITAGFEALIPLDNRLRYAN